jgi:Na+/H+ antiporter NhaB
MNKLTEIFKRHVYCIIIIAAILLISGAIVAYKTQDDALSMTASVVSIVLAVVVIFYTFYHSERSSRMTEQSERNMRETKEAVSEILHKTDKTVDMLNQMQPQTATDRNGTFKVLVLT